MMGGFDANVPARKPRTRIGQVLSELASEPEETATRNAERETTNGVEPAAKASQTAAEPGLEEKAQAREAVETTEKPATAPPRTAAPSAPPEGSRLAAGRDRVASLRERLAQASRAPVTAVQPKRAAAAVLEVVQDLRARLDEAIQERSEMARALDETRGQLTKARTDVEKERKLRAGVEAQAEERARIAADAVTEAEALAAERDQVLSELAEQRMLDDEQAALLAEAEAVLERRDQERARAAEEMSELRDELEARAAQIVEVESRLDAAAADYARLEARCRELEGEVSELAEAREALETLQASVHRRDG